MLATITVENNTFYFSSFVVVFAVFLCVSVLSCFVDTILRRVASGHWGHVPPLLQIAGHGGTVIRRTANKKLTNFDHYESYIFPILNIINCLNGFNVLTAAYFLKA